MFVFINQRVEIFMKLNRRGKSVCQKSSKEGSLEEIEQFVFQEKNQSMD